MVKTFKETQKFNQLWLWILLFFVASIPFYGVYEQSKVISEITYKSLFDEIAFSMCMSVGLLLLVYLMRLETNIDQKGIRLYFFPFVKKEFLFEDIEEMEVLDYGFIGGWGIRFWTKYGTVFNIKGSMGLRIVLKNGKKYLIGTQKPEELKGVLQQQ
ncbi:MAG: hypothetical protein ACPHXR_04290 [Flavicella sp.]